MNTQRHPRTHLRQSGNAEKRWKSRNAIHRNCQNSYQLQTCRRGSHYVCIYEFHTYHIFSKKRPGRFWNWIMTWLLTFQLAPYLYCRWMAWKATKMLNLTQNGDIHCFMSESNWKCLIVLYYLIILLNISVQISSEKFDTKKKEGWRAFWRWGAKWREYSIWYTANHK